LVYINGSPKRWVDVYSCFSCFFLSGGLYGPDLWYLMLITLTFQPCFHCL